MGPFLALAVPATHRHRVKPGRRGICPTPQHARRRTGHLLQAGEMWGPSGRGGGRGKVFLIEEAERGQQGRSGDEHKEKAPSALALHSHTPGPCRWVSGTCRRHRG